MAKIRHLAIMTENQSKRTEFYKATFGLTRSFVTRPPTGWRPSTSPTATSTSPSCPRGDARRGSTTSASTSRASRRPPEPRWRPGRDESPRPCRETADSRKCLFLTRSRHGWTSPSRGGESSRAPTSRKEGPARARKLAIPSETHRVGPGWRKSFPPWIDDETKGF